MSEKISCWYKENDSIVENEEVDRNCLEDWFIDSYNNHSGEPPNQDEINCFMRGESVDYIPGKNLWCQWQHSLVSFNH